MKRKPILYLIIPCYNEEDVLPVTNTIFINKIESLIKQNKISTGSRVLFVNDGSKDETWNLICEYSKESEHVEGISLSRNRGHQNAVLAGLMEAKDLCDITVSIDCDGQDDINAVDEMVDKYNDGYEIVYGVRSKRETDTFFKRFTAESYYKVLKLLGGEIVFNHADYRLLSSKVLQEFANYGEVNLFLRGLVPMIGFRSTTVSYERHERIAGSSHYPLSKMLKLAFDGITSLSITPIRIIDFLGLFIIAAGLIMLIANLINNAELWICMSLITLLFGIMFVCLGVVGEYVGKTYLETKHRPRFIISKRTYDICSKD